MASGRDFADACKDTARQLRRLPAEMRRTLAREVRDTVAEPLADDIRSSFHGPYGRALSGSVKVRVSTDPQIVVGGSRRVVSGGASARSLVYGVEFGGGRRVKAVPRRPGRKGYRRHTTRQFPTEGQHAVFGTIGRTIDRTLERWSEAVDKVIGGVFRG